LRIHQKPEGYLKEFGHGGAALTALIIMRGMIAGRATGDGGKSSRGTCSYLIPAGRGVGIKAIESIPYSGEILLPQINAYAAESQRAHRTQGNRGRTGTNAG